MDNKQQCRKCWKWVDALDATLTDVDGFSMGVCATCNMSQEHADALIQSMLAKYGIV